MSLQTTLHKINSLLYQLKHHLSTGDFCLPLYRCSRSFDFKKKIMTRHSPQPITFSKTSVSGILRIVQILVIVRNLLLNNKFITKRNLYYQLVRYYQYYAGLDADLLVVCDSLKVDRSSLNIIVSSKLQLFWFNETNIDKNRQIRIELSYKKFVQQEQKALTEQALTQEGQAERGVGVQQQLQSLKAVIFQQKQHLPLLPNQIFKIPNCPKLQINVIYPPLSPSLSSLQIQQSSFSYSNSPLLSSQQQSPLHFLIMQKQSLFQILTESLTHRLPTHNRNWLLMNSKGYPDMTALQFVNQLINLSKHRDIRFYYIGDNDIYGMDIMLNYAIGNQVFGGVWKEVRWLCGFEQVQQWQEERWGERFSREKFVQKEHRRQTPQDRKKAKEILAREYFQIEHMTQLAAQQQQQQKASQISSQANQLNQQFITKASQWRRFLQNLIEQEYQCEVESYFKNWDYPFELVELMIDEGFYL